MNSLNHLLGGQHRQYDAALADAEMLVAGGDWDAALPAAAAVADGIRAHFGREESVLFPAFETATGSVYGPTAVMRDEHAQMRELLDAMAAAAARHDGTAWLGLSDTLVLMMQQHNMKEEQILFPMAVRALGPALDALLDALHPQPAVPA